MRGYPALFSNFITLIVALLFLSGCLLIPTMLDMRLEWELDLWRPSNNWRWSIAIIHTLTAIVMALILGALWSIHIRVGLRQKKHHRSGLLMLALFTALMLTSVIIFYSGNEQISVYASLIHTLIGGALLMLFYYHRSTGIRMRHTHHHAK
ncbi:MAG: hypothetical protein H0W44_07445 [Gammaproteobacteria bacterium]|nr:hypothetical protein [Gammaproteobacteria bacterium]